MVSMNKQLHDNQKRDSFVLFFVIFVLAVNVLFCAVNIKEFGFKIGV